MILQFRGLEKLLLVELKRDTLTPQLDARNDFFFFLENKFVCKMTAIKLTKHSFNSVILYIPHTFTGETAE